MLDPKRLLEEADFTPDEREHQNKAAEVMLKAIKKGELDLTNREIWLNAAPLLAYTSEDIETEYLNTNDDALSHLITTFGENYQRNCEY